MASHPSVHGHHKLDYKKGGRYQVNRGQEVDYRSKVTSSMLDEYGQIHCIHVQNSQRISKNTIYL